MNLNFVFATTPVAVLKDLVLPWLFRQLGVGKWLRTRANHTPELAVADAAAQADALALQNALDAGRSAPTSVDRWRAQEIVQVALVEGRVTGR